ncbi:class I SAM-dependent methyltransferase [Methyloligella solikamskensis]|uniref:Class I SAM-dependent methyltransferase n=1 Tax=Methyloligella solikamskensis TaxID=1177756 RepID=A0ABW3J9D7_9HYPH
MPPEPATPLAKRLCERIAQDGPLTLAAYMEACLTDPESGYYATRQPLGARGDFITAPEISQIFGELIGIWTIATWQALGQPDEITIAELGPGRGTLMRDALRSWRNFPDFRRRVRIALVEKSETLKSVQAETLAPEIEQEPPAPVTWHDSLETVPEGPLIVIANEFLDALPIRQFIRRGSAWHERLVTCTETGALAFMEGDRPAEALPGLDRFESARDGAIAEIRPDAAPLISSLAKRAKAAPLASLFIDYGPEVFGPGDTLQAVSAHGFADPLADPGAADLTAHVDFGALSQQAAQEGLSAYGPMPQGEFLLKLGLAQRQEQLMKTATPDQRPMLASGANRLIDPQQMGVLFKAFVLTGSGGGGRGLPPPPPFYSSPQS